MHEVGEFPCALIAFCEKWPQFSEWMSGKAYFLQLGTPGQAAHSSNRRMISMSQHPNRMTEPHNRKGMP